VQEFSEEEQPETVPELAVGVRTGE